MSERELVEWSEREGVSNQSSNPSIERTR